MGGTQRYPSFHVDQMMGIAAFHPSYILRLLAAWCPAKIGNIDIATLMPAIICFMFRAITAKVLYFRARPALGKGDAQFSANRQLPRIRHHGTACVLYHAIAARQDLLRIEHDQVLRSIVHSIQSLLMPRAYRFNKTLRQIGLPVFQAGKIDACGAQALRHGLTLPMLMLLAIGKSALHALLQLVQLLRLVMQLLRRMHQASLQVIHGLHGVLHAVALRALNMLRNSAQASEQRIAIRRDALRGSEI